MIHALRSASSTAFVLAVLLTACKRPSGDANESRQMPKLPPPPAVEAPAELSVAVVVDGQAAPALDRARLDAVPADFADGDRRAWKMETLLGEPASRPGAAFTITGDKDVAIVLHRPRSAADEIPVLVLNRRGQLLAAMVESDAPFPGYHGQGHRLERRGDPMPRVEGVKRIEVSQGAGDAGR
ncbi:MAG TPA: hypothetical protein VGL81_22755 [Polyangiaceae bacterium]|jgi:hypothetical protein